jgi:hypothetical protein
MKPNGIKPEEIFVNLVFGVAYAAIAVMHFHSYLHTEEIINYFNRFAMASDQSHGN